MMVIGDAAGLVDPLWGGGIGYAIRSGRTAGRTAVKAFDQQDFSKGFLKGYEVGWGNSQDGRSLQRSRILSRMLLGLSTVDRDVYIRFQGSVMRFGSSRVLSAIRKIMDAISARPPATTQ